MLALTHPDIAARMAAVSSGLFPIRPDGKLSLAIKASKEALVAIRENGGFAVYVVPVPARDGVATSLVTAFFDDADEPLVIRTPLFGDETPSMETVALLTGEEMDLYLFDDLGWERMSYRCRIEDPGSHFRSGPDIRLAPFTRENSRVILSFLAEWFGRRTPLDDSEAIRVRLSEELWPSDQAILDLRGPPNKYLGSDGFVMSALERDETRPGFHQERDIAALFRRFLSPEQVILNPFRRGSDREYADLVCATQSTVILIQAKDSPTDARAMARSLERKRRVSQAQLKAALGQITGAFRYTDKGEPVPLTCNGEDINLYVNGRALLGLAVVKEIFPAQSDEILSAIERFRSAGRNLAILDFPALSTFVHHFPDEDRFIAELGLYTDQMIASETWIPAKAFLNERLPRT